MFTDIRIIAMLCWSGHFLPPLGCSAGKVDGSDGGCDPNIADATDDDDDGTPTPMMMNGRVELKIRA